MLRCGGKGVLLLTADLPTLRDIFRCIAHVVIVEHVPQAIDNHRVNKIQLSHLLAVTQVRAMRRLAHTFLATGNDNFTVAA